MATITEKKASIAQSVQESQKIENLSSEPFYIADTDLNTLDFDSIEFDIDGTQFESILAYEQNKKDTYDYMTQCNFDSTKVFDKGDFPLRSPNGFAAVKLSVLGGIRVNR